MTKIFFVFVLVSSVLTVVLYSGFRKVKTNTTMAKAPISFYTLKAELIDGSELKFEDLRGKKVLIVNTASKCGFTKQYEALEKLHQLYKDKLVLIGFPSNDFGAQEPAGNEEILEFCKKNYGVTFILASKSKVVKGEGQNPVYTWLSSVEKNGWNTTAPSWNFAKYLINEEGELLKVFPSGIAPLDEKITGLIQ